jgi:uncharacterized protein RhaS with RHS repeats
MYISQDPIKLNGNNPTLYAYVKDTNNWVDELGLEEITIYHYTDKKGYNAIRGTGVIEVRDPSRRGKGAYNNPPGVYVSTLPPEQMASQNLGKIGLTNDKTKYVATFTVDDSLLKDASKNGSKLYLEEDVNLRENVGTIEKNSCAKE